MGQDIRSVNMSAKGPESVLTTTVAANSARKVRFIACTSHRTVTKR